MRQFLRREWIILLILFATLMFAVAIYPSLPEQVPIHWNIKGEIDDYASKTFGAFFIPILNIIMYVFFLVLPKLDPKKQNYEKFTASYKIIRYCFHIFMVLTYLVTILASLGYKVDVSLWIPVAVAILFILIGNIMGRVRHNYFVGFKFPWTLANEEVWKKTHRFGSKLMVLGGFIALIGAFLTQGSMRFIVLMVGVLAPTVITAIYSYLVYKNIAKQ